MKHFSLLFAILILNGCADKGKNPICAGFSDNRISVSITQINSIWVCFKDKTLVVHGFLALERGNTNSYYLYDTIAAAKYTDISKRVRIKPNAEVAKTFNALIDEKEIIRVKIHGSLITPYVLENISNVNHLGNKILFKNVNN